MNMCAHYHLSGQSYDWKCVHMNVHSLCLCAHPAFSCSRFAVMRSQTQFPFYFSYATANNIQLWHKEK